MKSDELRNAFRERVPILEVFGKWVTEQVLIEVKELLGAGYSEYFFKVTPRHRVKDVEGFVEKSNRAGKSYTDPLKEITDQVGTRFVVLLHDHSQIVNRAIQAVPCWNLTMAKDIEDLRLSNPHHFDYESYHWTVSPKVAMEIEGSMVGPDVSCEIQVRTLLQHAYAELAHSTIYKPRTTAKPEVQRIMARGSALIETTDGVFQLVADEIEKACGKLDSLLQSATEWFSFKVQNGHSSPSGIAMRIADAYAEELALADWTVVRSFLDGKAWLPDVIRENKGKPLFDDPVIVLVFWVVSELRHEAVLRWPYDISMLRPIFAHLGIATDGCLD